MSKINANTPSSPIDPDSVDPNNTAAWEQAEQQAKDAGIRWERPTGDDRTAQEIIDDTPLLRDLGNQAGVRESLEARVGGDIETDADAAYRAAQVLEHIETFDANGDRLASNDIDNGRVDGFTRGGDAKNGTEAGRLQDFGKYGFSNLKGELNDVTSAVEDPEARKQAEELGIQWERPEGDDRSAEDIINGSELLKNLGNQSDVKDMLKERVGDFENDADAAYRATQVLEHIERFDGDGNDIVGGDVGNGSINGFTNSGEAKNGTEAGRLQDFGKHGFTALKGKMENPDSVGDNKEAREAAEKAGIKWELPEDDKRSAQDIIEDNPLLANLGNQSGVKDMLKDRVGDFETDANAAYRAAQVLDRISLYNDKGETQSGGNVSNTSVDGFTKSGEAKHDTEAGRLQDFGKYGFENLPEAKRTDDIGSYKDFLSANPDADEASKTFAKYAAIIGENYDLIKGKVGTDDKLSADDLKRYMDENPQISDDFKEALNFWSKPGAFSQLETAADPLKFKPDDNVSAGDISNWIKTQSPKDASAAVTFLSGAANGNTVGDVDVSKLNKDIFENPGNHSTEDKAAALQELLAAQQLIIKGSEAGMWSDDYGKVSIANASRTHPDPNEVMKDLNEKISILESDPDVVKFLNENVSKQMSTLLEENPSLKEALEKNYEDVKSGAALDTLWDTHSKDGLAGQHTALAEFYTSATQYQEMLGIDDPAAIQKAVMDSKHGQEFQDYYENSLASGTRLEELMKTNTYEEAISVFTSEVAVYNATLDPEVTSKLDTELNENFNRIAQENAFKDASFDDLKTAFGIDGGDELDEEKVKSIIEEVAEKNPEFFVNPNGTVSTPDQILAGIRGSWDVLRQGTKSLAELKSDWLSPGLQDAANKGVLHGISGVFMAGVTIAKGANSGGNLSEKALVDITTGSVQTATLLAEGGIKNYRDYLNGVVDKVDESLFGHFDSLLDDVKPEVGALNEKSGLAKKLNSNLANWENAAKGLGGLAGVVAGAYGIFDGVNAVRRGDDVTGGINITAGSLGALAGLASAVEGGAGLAGLNALRVAAAPIAGVLGMAAAGVGAIAMFLPGLIAEGKMQTKQDNFGDLLGDYLTKYEIDGVPNGDIFDVPEEAWPETSSGMS